MLRSVGLLVALCLSLGCQSAKMSAEGELTVRSFGAGKMKVELDCEDRPCVVESVTTSSPGLTENGLGSVTGIVGAAASVFGGGQPVIINVGEEPEE
jgi:hypothetical protein